jgi:hypothetical protein
MKKRNPSTKRKERTTAAPHTTRRKKYERILI